MPPLHNTRILDLTRLLPGAVCTMLLRDLGAEISNDFLQPVALEFLLPL